MHLNRTPLSHIPYQHYSTTRFIEKRHGPLANTVVATTGLYTKCDDNVLVSDK